MASKVRLKIIIADKLLRTIISCYLKFPTLHPECKPLNSKHWEEGILEVHELGIWPGILHQGTGTVWLECGLGHRLGSVGLRALDLAEPEGPEYEEAQDV